MLKRDVEQMPTPAPGSGPQARSVESPTPSANYEPPIWQDSSLELVNGVEVTDFVDTIPGEIDRLLNP